MPPTSDGNGNVEAVKGMYTVGCTLRKLVPDETHIHALQDAVLRTHCATILVTQLLNLHVRRALAKCDDVASVFDRNWLMKAYQEVTVSNNKSKAPTVDAELRTARALMPAFTPVDRKGLTQMLMHECTNLAAVAKNNVWMHYVARVRAHVFRQLTLTACEYAA